MSTQKIEIRKGNKTLNKRKVLQNINGVFQGGKIYGLCGTNGSGKTMLLRSLCGLILLDDGEVEVNGEILGRDCSFPENVGVFIEKPGYIPEYTGYENLKYISEIRNCVGEDRIQELLHFFGLDKEEKLIARKYSLGMKQKLGLAMALLEYPKLLLLDEPWNALDQKSVKNLIDKLIQLKEKGCLIIVASHDHHMIKKIADEVLWMEEGRLVQEVEWDV